MEFQRGVCVCFFGGDAQGNLKDDIFLGFKGVSQVNF